MHPETVRAIAARQTQELHAAARAAGQIRRARTSRPGASPLGSGLAAAVRGRQARRLRLLAKALSGQQPA